MQEKRPRRGAAFLRFPFAVASTSTPTAAEGGLSLYRRHPRRLNLLGNSRDEYGRDRCWANYGSVRGNQGPGLPALSWLTCWQSSPYSVELLRLIGQTTFTTAAGRVAFSTPSHEAAAPALELRD